MIYNYLVADTFADMRNISGSSTLIMQTLGKTTTNDGLGKWWKWNAAEVGADNDNTILRVTGVATGGWNETTMPASRVLTVGGAKTYYLGGLIIHTNSGVTAGGAGDITFNITTDGTAGGTPIFTSLLNFDCTPTRNMTSPEDKGFMNHKSTAVDLKTITFTGATGRGVLLGGVTLANMPNSVDCNLFVIGD